jgi:hypothetical protein
VHVLQDTQTQLQKTTQRNKGPATSDQHTTVSKYDHTGNEIKTLNALNEKIK